MVKKILIVTQYFYPENFRVNDIAFSLQSRGYIVDVLTGLPNYPKGKVYPGYRKLNKRHEVINSVNVRRLPIMARRQNPISLVLNYLSFIMSAGIWAKFTKKNYDFILAFEVSPMTQILPAICLAKRKKIPVVAYIQDIWPESLSMAGKRPRPLLKKRITAMARYIYKSLDHILIPSIKTQNWIEKVYDQTPISYWPQYYESFYSPIQEISQKSIRPFTLIFTGNIGSSQGLDVLIDVVSILKLNVTPERFKIHLIGDGRAKKQLIKTVNEADISEYFTFSDAVSPQEIPSLLAQADLAYLSFAHHPYFEAVIPAKLQSYMACGIPTLVYGSGESARIINEAKAGYHVSPPNIDGIADTLLDIMNQKAETLEKLGKNARKYAVEHFEKEKLLDWFEEHILKGIYDV